MLIVDELNLFSRTLLLVGICYRVISGEIAIEERRSSAAIFVVLHAIR